MGTFNSLKTIYPLQAAAFITASLIMLFQSLLPFNYGKYSGGEESYRMSEICSHTPSPPAAPQIHCIELPLMEEVNNDTNEICKH